MFWCLRCRNIKVFDYSNYGKKKKKIVEDNEVGIKGYSEGVELDNYNEIIMIYEFKFIILKREL